MKVSVIMPSFLGEYEGCASEREDKFLRAINSFLDNDYPHKELIVVSDGCEITNNILNVSFKDNLYDGSIKHVKLKKQKLFSGKVRSAGISIATGNIIMYLDTDDMYGANHISTVIDQMQSEDVDWCYFSDFIRTDGGLVKKDVELEHGSVGTSSIAHRNHLEMDWKKCDGYGHDFKFVEKLMDWSDNHVKIYGATYIICHIPNQIDN